MNKVLPFMILNGEQKYITENYVSIPPALVITDEAGAIWTLGFIAGPISGGEFTFNVLRNGVDTGEFASRIERRKSEIWIFGVDGWKRMQVHKVGPVYVYGIRADFKFDSKIEPVIIDIYWNDNPEKSIATLLLNSMSGSHWKNLTNPIVCNSGQWLFAISKRLDISVVGYIGGENLRSIPVRERTT